MTEEPRPEKVRVVFFASLRDAVGMAELEVEASTIVDLLAKLRATLSAGGFQELTADNVKIAVNQSLIEQSDYGLQLGAGDEIAFLPPVTGG